MFFFVNMADLLLIDAFNGNVRAGDVAQRHHQVDGVIDIRNVVANALTGDEIAQHSSLHFCTT